MRGAPASSIFSNCKELAKRSDLWLCHLTAPASEAIAITMSIHPRDATPPGRRGATQGAPPPIAETDVAFYDLESKEVKLIGD